MSAMEGVVPSTTSPIAEAAPAGSIVALDTKEAKAEKTTSPDLTESSKKNGKRAKGDDASSGDEKPLAKKSKASKSSKPPPVKKRPTAIQSDDEDDDEDMKNIKEEEDQAPHLIASVAVKVDASDGALQAHAALKPTPQDKLALTTATDAPSTIQASEEKPFSALSSSATAAPDSTKDSTALVNSKNDADMSDMSDEDDLPLSKSKKGEKSVVKKAESEEEDAPLASKAKGRSSKSKRQSTPVKSEEASDDDSDGNEPLSKPKRKAVSTKRGKKEEVALEKMTKRAPKKPKKYQDESEDTVDDGEDDYDEDEQPKAKVAAKKRKRATKKEEDEDSDNSKPSKKKGKAKKVKEEEEDSKSLSSPTKTPAKKGATEKGGKKSVEKGGASEEPEDLNAIEDGDPEADAVYEWWKDANADGTVKWTTLSHNGVWFPPPYEPLPADIKLQYDGSPVDLSIDAEEVAYFFAEMLETDHAKDNVFQQNFFKDFLDVLKKHPSRDSKKITSFAKCNFRSMYEYIDGVKAIKRAMDSADKKAAAAIKNSEWAPYTTCVLDGRKEKVGNFKLEPPGLFRGRGAHPKKGTLKYRLKPEDITINIGEGETIPTPNVPGKWKAVKHDNTVTWLATWKENVNNNVKYVMLAAGSSLKGQSDMSKFEKARKLNAMDPDDAGHEGGARKRIEVIRANYTAELKDPVTETRQRATAMYFIDRLALRAGNEKGEDVADTVGTCSLRVEHILQYEDRPLVLSFDFLGKDSIRYVAEHECPAQICKNVRIFKKPPKVEGDLLFDRLDTTKLNNHLRKQMEGLSAKVFRTFNASVCMEEQLKLLTPTDKNATVAQKLMAYNEANRQVAILCNHKKSVSAKHGEVMEKANNKLLGFQYQRMKLCIELHGVDKKSIKDEDFQWDSAQLTDEWVRSYELQSKMEAVEAAKKKFKDENKKLEKKDEKPLTDEVLENRIAAIETKWEKISEETEAKEIKSSRAAEAIKKAITKLDERIENHELTVHDKEEGKEISLGTSKMNYIDPRITIAWAKRNDVDLKKLLSKVLQEKFAWAIEVDKDYEF